MTMLKGEFLSKGAKHKMPRGAIHPVVDNPEISNRREARAAASIARKAARKKRNRPVGEGVERDQS